jgi:hypothetical protein
MNTIGGNIFSGNGGYVQIWNWKRDTEFVSGGGTSVQPEAYEYLDVASWKFLHKNVVPINWYSGCWGAQRGRGVIESTTLLLKVFWDYQNPPEGLFNRGQDVSVKLIPGDPSMWAGHIVQRMQAFVDDSLYQRQPVSPNGHGQLTDGNDWMPFWIAPQCILTGCDTTDSSMGDNDDIIFQDLIVTSDSCWNYLPDQEAADAYAVYVNSIAGANRIATA